MIKKWSLTIPELSGEEVRRAYVYVPTEWAKNPQHRYPVLYMFDGQNVFYDRDATYGKSWGMKEYLERHKVPLIVAAVECSHLPPCKRLCEYSPYSFSARRWGSVTGEGKETMDWFVGVFKPYVDKHFPTEPDREHTFIAGSSMGGLMALYAVTEYNHIFSRAAALSPALSFSPKEVDAMQKNHPLPKDTAIYMSAGERELSPTFARRFGKAAQRLLSQGIAADCRIILGGEHCEACWEKEIPLFLPFLMSK